MQPGPVPARHMSKRFRMSADGRKIHDVYLFELKKPEESRYAYDYCRLVATIPAANAFRPLAGGGCPHVR